MYAFNSNQGGGGGVLCYIFLNLTNMKSIVHKFNPKFLNYNEIFTHFFHFRFNFPGFFFLNLTTLFFDKWHGNFAQSQARLDIPRLPPPPQGILESPGPPPPFNYGRPCAIASGIKEKSSAVASSWGLN